MVIKAKRAMTSFDVAAVVSELNKVLSGSRLSNVYDVAGGGLLFKFRGDQRVIAVPGQRVHITRYDIAGRGFPSPLVMGFRKYVRDAILEDAGQLGFDRVAWLRFRRAGQDYRVIVEVLPRGVIALVDTDSRILQVTERKSMRDRVLRHGERYQPPPSGPLHPEELNVESLRARLSDIGNVDAVRALVRGLGYPGEAVEEVLARLGMEPSTPASELLRVAEALIDEFKGIYKESLNGRGYMLEDPRAGSPVTVVPFEPRGLVERYGLRVGVRESFSAALDEYFVEGLKRVEEAEMAAAIEAEKAKLMASLERARENLERLARRLKDIENVMTVIGENIDVVYEAYNCVNRVRRSLGWDAVVEQCPNVVDVRPSEGVVVLQLSGRLVPLDVRMDPSQLLVELSRKAGETRAKIERGQRAVSDIEARLRELEERLRRRLARARAAVRRREWYEKYHWLITRNGYLAIGGRDAGQNESVVKRYLNEKRIFMHADVHGAPIVVVFAEGREPPEGDLRDAALLTAAYSKAWKTGTGSVDVYWVWGSQVSKSAPAGEYLARGAFMVYGKRNYIRNVELRLAIGVGVEDEAPVIIVGPQDLVRRRSIVYAILIPGDEDPSKLASRLRRLLASKAGDESRGYVEALEANEIRQRIPGRSRLIYIGRGENSEPPRPIRVLPGSPQG